MGIPPTKNAYCREHPENCQYLRHEIEEISCHGYRSDATRTTRNNTRLLNEAAQHTMHATIRPRTPNPGRRHMSGASRPDNAHFDPDHGATLAERHLPTGRYCTSGAERRAVTCCSMALDSSINCFA
ncbi:hypothetical protein SAMN05192579_11975 [Rhodanobacter glycinis]|uniref:Uncharacterized protein n=1 Tax=Rhodanobacter glycinis TaxID=582702 RepID=A0A1I4FTC2_9GAMM|nr:hypothetical protein SAMN05192579_11975 [Rhodanobacter glycinis]